MEFIVLPFYVFLELIKWLIFIEIILSWAAFFGVFIAIPFINAIIGPMFTRIREMLPVQFFGLDFTALIILFSIQILQRTMETFFPILALYIPSIHLF